MRRPVGRTHCQARKGVARSRRPRDGSQESIDSRPELGRRRLQDRTRGRKLRPVPTPQGGRGRRASTRRNCSAGVTCGLSGDYFARASVDLARLRTDCFSCLRSVARDSTHSVNRNALVAHADFVEAVAADGRTAESAAVTTERTLPAALALTAVFLAIGAILRVPHRLTRLANLVST